MRALKPGHGPQPARLAALLAICRLGKQPGPMFNTVGRFRFQLAGHVSPGRPLEQGPHFTRRDFVFLAQLEAGPFDVGPRVPRVAE